MDNARLDRGKRSAVPAHPLRRRPPEDQGKGMNREDDAGA